MKEIEYKMFYRGNNKVKYIDIKSIKNGSTFYYLGLIYTNVPEYANRANNDSYEIDFKLAPICGMHYIMKFIKVSDDEAMEVRTGRHFKIGVQPIEIECHNPEKLLKLNDDGTLYINKDGIIGKSNLYAKLLYFNFGEKNSNELINSFTLFNYYAKKVFQSSLLDFFKLIYPTEFEVDFYNKNDSKLSYYSEKPKIGEYFGYVGNIYSLISKMDIEINKKCYEKQIIENNYPLLFKKISDDEAIEVTTGIKFYLKALSADNIQDEEIYENPSLIIDAVAYIMPTEEYKEIYGKATSNFEEFNKWLHEQEDKCKILSAQSLKDCELVQYPSAEGAYDIARVENAMYDLDKKLKLVKKEN